MKTLDYLIIRHLKKNHPSLKMLKRIIAKNALISIDCIGRTEILHFLSKVVDELHLYKGLEDFVSDCTDCFHRRIDEKDDFLARSINGMCAKIRFYSVEKIPDYPVPSRFKR